MTVDVGEAVEMLSKRIRTLEQRITSPEYVVPAGGSPTFTEVKIGEWTPGELGGAARLTVNPNAPTDVDATAGSNYANIFVDVTWAEPTDNTAAAYDIDLYLKSEDLTTWNLVTFQRTSGTSWRFDGLLPDRIYGVRVASVNPTGRTSVSVPEEPFEVITGADTTIPAQTTTLEVVGGVGSLTALWDDSTEPDHSHYRIQVSTAADFSTTVHDDSTTASIVSFTDLESGVQHHVRVADIDTSGHQGPWSDVVDVTPGVPEVVIGANKVVNAQFLAGIADWTQGWHTTGAQGGNTITTGAGTDGNAATITVVSGTGTAIASDAFAVTPGQVIDLSAALKSSGNGAWLRLAFGAVDDFALGGMISAVQVVASGTSDAASVPASTTVDASLRRYSRRITVPAGVAFARVLIYNWAPAGSSYVTVEDVAASLYISDATIDAQTTPSGISVIRSLGAEKIKFGQMSGDRIKANSADIMVLRSGKVSARTIELDSDGILIGKNAAGNTGWALSRDGFKAYDAAGNPTITLNRDGSGTFSGTLNAAGGTFSGTLVGVGGTFTGTLSAAQISGGTLTGINISGITITASTFKTADSGYRVEIPSFYGVPAIFMFSGGGWEWSPAQMFVDEGGRSFQIFSPDDGSLGGPTSLSLTPTNVYIDGGPLDCTAGFYQGGVAVSLSTHTHPKTFVIQHPSNSDKYLVHAVIEGPTADVYYRGEATLDSNEGQAVVVLPDYFESLTKEEGRTVLITPILDDDSPDVRNLFPALATSRIEDGKFVVKSIGGAGLHGANFYWEVKAVRKDVEQFDVEPPKSEYVLHGSGPYTYLTPKSPRRP